MDWQQEIIASLIWVFQVIGVTAVLFPLMCYLLIKTTRWGKQFWAITANYISPVRSIKPSLYFFTVIFFSLITVRIDILFSEWNKALYNALQAMDTGAFWIQMMVFAVLSAIHIFNALLVYYIRQRFMIQWRTWLNDHLLNKWLDKQAYYKILHHKHRLENPDQRIQQDIQSYISMSLTLSIGLIRSVTSIFAFTIILWNLSGDMQIGDFTLPHAMVFLVFLYVIVITVFAFQIGRPLVALNFNNERLNADYRYSLIRVKEYAESIAFFRGEKSEKNILTNQFKKVIDNVWQMVYRTLKFDGFNLTMTQASVIFPFLIQASRFFSKEIQLGELMQTTQAFRKVQTSLSFFRNTYDNFASYRAMLDRLTGLQEAIATVNDVQGEITFHTHNSLAFKHLTVRTPEGKTLIYDLTFSLPNGKSLLIQGESGVGKTTLLRTIAGLWPFAEGEIYCPQNRALFLSQKPYLPQGRLIDALYYPETVDNRVNIEHAKTVLIEVQLGHLVPKLTEEGNWTRILSLGEQQRLAFARVLIYQPDIVFLDESTASMDEGLEDAMYRLLQRECPNMLMISVGHRSTLYPHHHLCLTLLQNGQWALAEISP